MEINVGHPAPKDFTEPIVFLPVNYEHILVVIQRPDLLRLVSQFCMVVFEVNNLCITSSIIIMLPFQFATVSDLLSL